MEACRFSERKQHSARHTFKLVLVADISSTKLTLMPRGLVLIEIRSDLLQDRSRIRHYFFFMFAKEHAEVAGVATVQTVIADFNPNSSAKIFVGTIHNSQARHHFSCSLISDWNLPTGNGNSPTFHSQNYFPFEKIPFLVCKRRRVLGCSYMQ